MATVMLDREIAIETAMSRMGLKDKADELLDILEKIELEPEFEKAEADIKEGRLFTLKQVMDELTETEDAWKKACK